MTGDTRHSIVCNQVLVSSELGGAGAIGLRLAADVEARGGRACVLVPAEGVAARKARELGLSARVYPLRAASGASPLSAAWSNWRVSRSLRSHGPGLVHVHAPHVYGALSLGLEWSRLKRIVHVHLQQDDAAALAWALRRPPELVITCARFLVDQVREALPPRLRDRQRIATVLNAVDTVRFAPGDRLAARATLGVPAEPLLLMLANLAPHKGQETAIRAVASLRDRGIRVVCWLAGVERAGGEEYTAHLRNLMRGLGVDDRVRLLGQRDDAPALLRAADFFLLPSTNEGLPLSVLEAQAAGVPVLAAPTAGVPEVVADGRTGFLVPADRPDLYAERLADLVANPQLSERVAAAALRSVLDHHSEGAYCERVWTLYREALAA